jgi:hypothetical protein
MAPPHRRKLRYCSRAVKDDFAEHGSFSADRVRRRTIRRSWKHILPRWSPTQLLR